MTHACVAHSLSACFLSISTRVGVQLGERGGHRMMPLLHLQGPAWHNSTSVHDPSLAHFPLRSQDLIPQLIELH